MVMKALRDGASGGITKFILFGLLTIAVGGLVMTDVGGFFRGGSTGDNNVAKIGGEAISISEFNRRVGTSLSRIGMSPQEAYKLGYINQLLGAEVRSHLLSKAAADLDIRVGTQRIATQINSMVSPLVQPGQTPTETLKQILMNQGMSEQEFVADMGKDMSNTLLSAAINGGLQGASPDMTADLYRYQNEKRTVEYIAFTNGDLKDQPQPEAEQISAIYEATKEAYATPELRSFKLIKVKNDSLKSSIEITEEELRQNYEDNVNLYMVNELRRLDQAILDTEDQAKKVRAALDAGKALKAAVKAAGASDSAYIGEQDFENDGLIEETKAAVLAAKEGDKLGPISTPLGWYVVTLKKISPTKTKSFDEVKAEIKKELLENQIIDQHYELANAVDDLFAGGATLEDVKKEIDVDVTDLAAMNQLGRDKDGNDALKKHEKIRQSIIDTGFTLSEGETSAVFETQEGDFMAVHLASISPKTYTPFEDVKDDLQKRWIADQSRLATQAQAMKILAEAGAGKSLQDIAAANGKKVQTVEVNATGEPKAPLDQGSLGKIFNANINTPVAVDIENGVAIAIITKSSWPEKIDEKAASFAEIEKNLQDNIREEGLTLYLEAKREEYGASVNMPLLERAYGTPAAN